MHVQTGDKTIRITLNHPVHVHQRENVAFVAAINVLCNSFEVGTDGDSGRAQCMEDCDVVCIERKFVVIVAQLGLAQTRAPASCAMTPFLLGGGGEGASFDI